MKLNALVKWWGQHFVGMRYGGGYEMRFAGESVDEITDKIIAYCQKENVVCKFHTPAGYRIVPSATLPRDKIRDQLARLVDRDDQIYFLGWTDYPGPEPANLASVHGAPLPAINLGGVFHCSCGTNKVPRKGGKAVRSYWKVIHMIATDGHVCPSCGVEWHGVKVHPSTLRSWKKSHPEVDWEALYVSGGILAKTGAG